MITLFGLFGLFLLAGVWNNTAHDHIQVRMKHMVLRAYVNDLTTWKKHPTSIGFFIGPLESLDSDVQKPLWAVLSWGVQAISESSIREALWVDGLGWPISRALESSARKSSNCLTGQEQNPVKTFRIGQFQKERRLQILSIEENQSDELHFFSRCSGCWCQYVDGGGSKFVSRSSWNARKEDITYTVDLEHHQLFRTCHIYSIFFQHFALSVQWLWTILL